MCLFMCGEVHLLATANDKITRRLHCPLSKEARAAMHYMCAAHVGDKKMGKYSSAVLFCNPVWGEGHLHEQGLASSGCTIAAPQLSALFLEINPANCRHRFSQLTAGRWIWLGMQKKLHRAKTRREIMSQVLCLLDEGVVSSQNWALWPTGGLTDRQYPKCAHSIPMGQA